MLSVKRNLIVGTTKKLILVAKNLDVKAVQDDIKSALENQHGIPVIDVTAQANLLETLKAGFDKVQQGVVVSITKVKKESSIYTVEVQCGPEIEDGQIIVPIYKSVMEAQESGGPKPRYTGLFGFAHQSEFIFHQTNTADDKIKDRVQARNAKMFILNGVKDEL